MKISTKGRYGLRVLLDIALHQEGGPVILRDIAKRQKISEKYLWQVINPMKAAGFVNSERGSKGGYRLAKGMSEITLLDIISVLEGPVCVVDCVSEPANCDRSSACVARSVWGRIETSIHKTMRSITLKELVAEAKDVELHTTLNYMI
jgi:Rrf2 family protein